MLMLPIRLPRKLEITPKTSLRPTALQHFTHRAIIYIDAFHCIINGASLGIGKEGGGRVGDKLNDTQNLETCLLQIAAK